MRNIEENKLSQPFHPSIRAIKKIGFKTADYQYKVETSIFVHLNYNLEENQYNPTSKNFPFWNDVYVKLAFTINYRSFLRDQRTSFIKIIDVPHLVITNGTHTGPDFAESLQASRDKHCQDLKKATLHL